MTATYNGNTLNGESTSSAVTQTVNQAQLAMTLVSSLNPSTVGKTVKLTATLTSNGGLPNGQTVTFSYNGTTLGTGTINGGKATISTAMLPSGSDGITASYSGDADYTSASAILIEIVN